MPWNAPSLLGVLLVLGWAGQPASTRAPKPRVVTIGRPFALAPGARATLKAEGLEIGFARVVSDSRCPRGARCIAEGDPLIELWLSNKGGRVLHQLRTSPPEAQAFTHEGVTITLQKLLPYPADGRGISRPAYRATLIVTRS
jgi:hypothetical protein